MQKRRWWQGHSCKIFVIRLLREIFAIDARNGNLCNSWNALFSAAESAKKHPKIIFKDHVWQFLTWSRTRPSWGGRCRPWAGWGWCCLCPAAACRSRCAAPGSAGSSRRGWAAWRAPCTTARTPRTPSGCTQGGRLVQLLLYMQLYIQDFIQTKLVMNDSTIHNTFIVKSYYCLKM